MTQGQFEDGRALIGAKEHQNPGPYSGQRLRPGQYSRKFGIYIYVCACVRACVCMYIHT